MNLFNLLTHPLHPDQSINDIISQIDLHALTRQLVWENHSPLDSNQRYHPQPSENEAFRQAEFTTVFTKKALETVGMAYSPWGRRELRSIWHDFVTRVDDRSGRLGRYKGLAEMLGNNIDRAGGDGEDRDMKGVIDQDIIMGDERRDTGGMTAEAWDLLNRMEPREEIKDFEEGGLGSVRPKKFLSAKEKYRLKEKKKMVKIRKREEKGKRDIRGVRFKVELDLEAKREKGTAGFGGGQYWKRGKAGSARKNKW